ncbi:hypothetical protein CLPU_6c01510 [Gottschalkia purinilytica]|uniref:YbaK/aminoacyl-tRNA synthetase-associated domain-containing protein n=1 Tax=Gottschalkia purinilytica TaxID=1503 RepID=A0A0L0WBE2_GOTPU|nr:YbaK/EbsC family protein [Gottschalkia purinilytica]KNF08665.1 hypothetical protein CLPU_6c01510 [Gottschalkia purinilytica]
MDIYEEKIKSYMRNNEIKGEHMVFESSCHSVEEAAISANISIDDIVKNICMINEDGELIVAIVKGEDRASTTRVGKALGITRPRIATEEEVREKTGYVCGGVPSFGYKAIYLIDSKVMEREIVYTGGGSESSLIKISTDILKEINNGQVTRIRK